MFPWGFAQSADAIFPRYAIKRFCKFLLKKKLGNLILGDIDLDQVEVQIGKGIIQLSDLALNVDYINQKLGTSPVIIKEGSIGSLSVRIPWKVKNCQIEVEELEIVLSPCDVAAHDESCSPSCDGEYPGCNRPARHESGMTQGSVGLGSVSTDIHEGVKTIAKLVKWFLTSFNVKIKNLIVALDLSLEMDKEILTSHPTLVLRIAETEYGTCVLEDSNSVINPRCDNILGIAKLTNFIKFRGVVVEFLQMDEINDDQQHSSSSENTLSQCRMKSSPFHGMTPPILNGPSGGTLNLSIPWKNGSLDIHKVDADISIEPLEIKLQPRTIKWMICLWDSLKIAPCDGRGNMHCKASDSVYLNAKSQFHSSTPPSSIFPSDAGTSINGKFSAGSYAPINQESATDVLLPRTHVIPNWVPLFVDKNQENLSGFEPDFATSIDQFFECFDEMISSQSTLGNSGIWNWTCSVFNAITAASNLASGAGEMLSEQHHVETNLKAKVAAISVVLSFNDENQRHSQDIMVNNGLIQDLHRTNTKSTSNLSATSPMGLNANSFSCPAPSMDTVRPTVNIVNSIDHSLIHLIARCDDLNILLQICPQNLKFEAAIMHIKVDGYLEGNGFLNSKSVISGQITTIQHVQGEVHRALPPFYCTLKDPHSGKLVKNSRAANVSQHLDSTGGGAHGIGCESIDLDELVRVEVFESVGVSDCPLSIIFTSSNERSRSSTSFSVEMPPSIIWVDFYMVNVLLDLMKTVELSVGESQLQKESKYDVFDGKHDSSGQEDLKDGPSTYSKNSSGEKLQGNIVLSNARIIFCFPPGEHMDFRCFTSWDKFACLELSRQLDRRKVSDSSAYPNVNQHKGYSCTSSSYIQLSLGDLDFFLITSADKGALQSNSCMKDTNLFSSTKILSVSRGKNSQHSSISVLWQKGPVTGPWMAKRAWDLGTSQDSGTRNNVTGKGHEFASVTTAKNLEEANSHVRQEMLLSSAFLLHVRFPLVWIDLDVTEYQLLCHLVKLTMDGMSCMINGMDATMDESLKKRPAASTELSASQTAFLVECDVLDLCIRLEMAAEIHSSLQRELPGSWCSLRLTVDKFVLLSVSNIGGIAGASFMWISHGEGELHGSITETKGGTSAVAQDFLLISCKNSSVKRGSGEGTNALSSGSAGTAIILQQNPQLSRSSTSITIRCGTIIAPGGRMDWFYAICSFFSSPFHGNEAVEGSSQTGSLGDDQSHATSFFLDLVDIGLCYEPHVKLSVSDGGDLDSGCSGSTKFTERLGEPYVACLLVAASLKISNQTMANLATNDYTVRLQDLGLLLCESSSFQDTFCRYSVENLRETGYVKVAGEELVEAVLRTKCEDGSQWQLDCSDSHISLHTCHDTTSALFRLISQLQNILTPDVEDAIMHLQSRWNTVKQEHDEQNIINSVDNSDQSIISSASSEWSSGCVRERSPGLMDEILEDAFHFSGNHMDHPDHFDFESHISVDGHVSGDLCNFNSKTTSADDVFPRNCPNIGLETIQSSCSHETLLPQLIESYYVSDLLPAPKSSLCNYTSHEDFKSKSSLVHADAEYRKGGWYEDIPFRIHEDHILKENEQPGETHLHNICELPSINSASPSEPSTVKGRILLKNIGVKWRMYAGSDWPKGNRNDTNTLNTCRSIGRDTTVCLELSLSRMNLEYDMFPEGDIWLSKLSISVQDFYLYDHSRDAPWKMVLGYYHSKRHPRESHTKAFKLDLEAIRPDPAIPLEEYRLRLALLPMRLHLHQSQLDFLTNFFGEDSTINQSPTLPNKADESEMSTLNNCVLGGHTIAKEALLPFFQKFDIWPVVLRIDYIPHYIDLAALREGKYAELVNLVNWKGVELRLKHVHAVGVYGWSNVCETIAGEWLEDVSRSQIHKLLKGLAPIRSLFSVSSGAAKLVSLPLKSYKKDHRLIKGVQRGATAFLRSVSVEAVGLGVHLAAGAHDILLQTENVLATFSPSLHSSGKRWEKAGVRSNQPRDAQQGIHQAYESITDGLGKTASALVSNPLKTYQRGAGAGLALVSAIQAAPAAAVAPASAAARAVHCALLGVRNSLDPVHKKESMEKYMGPTRPRDHGDCR